MAPSNNFNSERALGTLQDRLVKELKLAGITSIEEANAFIREVYLPAHNARFLRLILQTIAPAEGTTPLALIIRPRSPQSFGSARIGGTANRASKPLPLVRVTIRS